MSQYSTVGMGPIIVLAAFAHLAGLGCSSGSVSNVPSSGAASSGTTLYGNASSGNAFSGTSSGIVAGATSGSLFGTTSGGSSEAASTASGSSAASTLDASQADVGAAASNEGGDAEGTEGSAVAADVTLTVLNFEGWCSVSINGGAGSTSADVLASVPEGSTATVVAQAASSAFIVGSDPWFGVTENDGGAAPGIDTGSGASETTTATVVVTGNPNTATGTACVSVCCGDAPNGTGCPTSNPCE